MYTCEQCQRYEQLYRRLRDRAEAFVAAEQKFKGVVVRLGRLQWTENAPITYKAIDAQEIPALTELQEQYFDLSQRALDELSRFLDNEARHVHL